MGKIEWLLMKNVIAIGWIDMGYRTMVSTQGGDRGIDITAHKDEVSPRILVQVKRQDGDIKETTIQSLKCAMREGLNVSVKPTGT